MSDKPIKLQGSRSPRATIRSVRGIEDFKNINLAETKELVFEHRMFVRDHSVGTFLEKALDIKLKACYISHSLMNPPVFLDKTELSLDARDLILFLESGKIVRMSNSEWVFFKLMTKEEGT